MYVCTYVHMFHYLDEVHNIVIDGNVVCVSHTVCTYMSIFVCMYVCAAYRVGAALLSKHRGQYKRDMYDIPPGFEIS